MKSTAAASSAGRELTINEKLTMFRQKKDESRKENDASVINCSTSKKNGATSLKIQPDGISRLKVVGVNSQVTAFKQSIQCGPNHNSLSIEKNLPRKESTVCKRSAPHRMDQKQRMSTLGIRPPSPAELKIKLDEYIMLAENAGIKIARSFITAVPSESNMKNVESQVMYWLTWIRFEGKAGEWEFTNSLFTRAKHSVISLSGLQAIATAEQQFYAERKNTSCSSTLKASSNLTSHEDSSIQRNSEGNKLSDVRMVMGEDGFSQGQLTAPKTLRFSLDSSDTSDSQPLSLKSYERTAVNAENSSSFKSISAIAEIPPKVQGKYADFLKSTNRTDLSSMNNLVELQECAVNSRIVSQFMSSDSNSVNDHDMSDLIVPFDTSIETIALADLSALTSGGAPKRRRSIRTPGGASLDILLGLGCCGDGASDSEGDDVNSMKRQSLSPVDSILRGVDSVMQNDDLAPQRCDLSARVSSLLSSAHFNIPFKSSKRSLPAGKKRVTRIQVGVSDVFSDDDEETAQPASIEGRDTEQSAPIEGMLTLQSASIEGMMAVQSAPMESSIVEMTLDTTESDFFADSKDVEITGSTLPRRSSTVRVSVVSFAGISAVSTEEVSSCDTMSVAFSTSTSGCRRSCRLSNASSSGSTKKARRQATPYAPRFARPSSGTSGSAKTSMDVMREDCGYGSYFNSMNSPDKPGADDSEFDLLATTPIIPDRRANRLQNA